MSDFDRFRHDRSRYERPGIKYRCGRGALWVKPCARGPGPDGRCGGTASCMPFRRDGRFQCTRPAWAGGPCGEGPLPDGTCAHTQPPCAPVPTLRALRGRLSAVAAILVLGLIGLTMGLAREQGPNAEASFATQIALRAIDSGPLTSKHAASIQWHDCSSCHAAHGTGAVGWWKAAWRGTDMNAQCRACHEFAVPASAGAAAKEATERTPHNFAAYADRKDRGPSACEACHVEHRGEHANIKRLADVQCNLCHVKKVTRFDADHPPFRALYPNFERTAIRFDHITHIYDYFQRADKKNFAPDPARLCVTCHVPGYAQKSTPPAGYDKVCAGCHEQQIQEAELTGFALPALPDRLRKPDRAKVRTACGRDLGEYETESDEKLTGIAAFLLGQPPGEIAKLRTGQDAAAKALFDAIFAMAADGADALGSLFAARAKDWGVEAGAFRLFDGLSLVTARQVACDWLARGEYLVNPDEKVQPGSWHADQHHLKYKPAGHADRVARDWVLLAARLDPSRLPDGDPRRAQLESLRREILGIGAGKSDLTPGLCTKCHSLVGEPGKEANGPLRVNWRFERSDDRPFTNFTHAHHLDLVLAKPIREPGDGEEAKKEPAAGCAFCHVLKRKQGNYDAAFRNFDPKNPEKFTSNFAGVGKQVCQQCHSSAGFRQDCQTCHRYHLEPRTHPREATTQPSAASPAILKSTN